MDVTSILKNKELIKYILLASWFVYITYTLTIGAKRERNTEKRMRERHERENEAHVRRLQYDLEEANLRKEVLEWEVLDAQSKVDYQKSAHTNTTKGVLEELLAREGVSEAVKDGLSPEETLRYQIVKDEVVTFVGEIPGAARIIAVME